MGLDGVELLLAIEEEFGVEITSSDAEKIITVGDVYKWLKDRLAVVDPEVCISQKIFYQLRRALMENFGLERRSITLDTRITDLISEDEVKDGWPFLQLFIDLKTPPYEVARELFGIRFSVQTLTVKELVFALLAINREQLAPEKLSPEDIWSRLVEVFVRTMSLRPEEVRPDAHIVRDLGID